MASEEKSKKVKKSDAFASVAFWQFMVFILLLAFVWANEVFDLAARVFDEDPTQFSMYRAALLSAAVITAGVVAVGQTYERQRSVVKELMTTCLYCHRVQTHTGDWMHVEDFFLTHYPVDMQRGACTDCAAMLKSVEDRVGRTSDAEA